MPQEPPSYLELSLAISGDKQKGFIGQVGMKTEKHNCPFCTAALETTGAGYAAHVKKCRKARQWQRDYFLEKGKWPERKYNRTSFLAGGGGTRRSGRTIN